MGLKLQQQLGASTKKATKKDKSIRGYLRPADIIVHNDMTAKESITALRRRFKDKRFLDTACYWES